MHGLRRHSPVNGCFERRAHACSSSEGHIARALLLEEIQYLSAALHPRFFDSQASDVDEDCERGFQVMRTFFIRSPDVFNPKKLHAMGDDEHMERIRAQFSKYTAL